MADQQDQLSSGGSVEKASASADTSKIRGKGSSGGSSGYRKRQNTGAISDSVEEKRRRQITGDPQTSQVDGNTAHTHLIDSSKGEGRIRGERRNHGAGLESYPDTDWRSHHKIHQASYSSGSSARVRSAARTNLPELNLTPTDCVASRTRSRTPQNNPQALVQATSSYDLSLPSGYGSRKTSTYSNVVASSSTTLITSHPSTSRGRGGQRMSECLEGFVSAVKALFPISTQTYHQEDSKSHGGATCSATSSSSTSSQVLGVKSSIRVGNAASNSVESGGGALAHDGAGTSGIASTANPPVSAAVSANPAHPHSTHKHLLRSRAKASGEQPKELPSSNKTSGKHHKKDTTTGSCSSSRHRSSSRVRKPVVESGSGGLGSVMSGNDSISATSVSSSIPSNQLVSTTGEEESASTATSATASGGPSGMSGTTGDSESDDGEVGRLQALLEARGLPPHVFGALGPRMQHLLNRSMGASSAAKAQQLLAGLQAVEDEGEQLQAVMNMGEILVMGNEDTLTGFPVKQVVAALINLLGIEHNFAIMTHACRALTYMMEALPRSSTVVVDAVPVFLQKLESIECMDVAEQCLTALAMLSRRHSKTILHAGGVSACLKFVDFFNITAQRAALTITANCCQNLHPDDFHLVVDSLPLLTSRLTNQDKKSVECVCQAFSRLVDSFQHDPVMLHKIINAELLQNLQQLLMITPPVNSTNNFITVLRMLSVISNRCPDLAQLLLQQNIAFTLSYLLTGSLEVKTEDVELVPRTPQEWFEITCLIEELMPPLPTDGIFSVNSLLERTSNQQETVQWEWRDERQCSHPFSTIDSRIIEMAFQNGEDEICLTSLGRTYTIDLTVMKQINEDIGMARSIFRRVNANPTEGKSPTCSSSYYNFDCSMDVVPPVIETNEWLVSFIRTLFSVLYEVYSSSAGPAVKCKCLRALLRMVYYASTDLLKDVLKNQVVSSHIAGMLASQDLRIVIGALQMASILMKRLPQVFGVHFHREGVLHQVRQLADPEVPLGVSPPKCPSGTSLPSPQPGPSNTPLSSTTMLSSSSATSPVVSPSSNGNILFGTIASSCQYKPNISASLEPHRTELNNSIEESAPQSAHLRIGDVLKKKRQNKKGRFSRLGGATTPQQTQQPESMFTGFTPKNNRFLGNLNPAKWGRKSSSSSTSNDKRDSSSSTNLSKPPSNPSLTGGNRDKAKAWVREQAAQFLTRYQDDAPCSHPALTVLARLTAAIQRLQSNELDEMLSALTELRDIVLESDISPFEMNYSGLIKALLNYLTTTDAPGNRYDRLRMFWKLFAESTMQQNNDIMDLNPGAFGALVTKLNSCVAQLEQFPVKVHDLPAGSGAGRGGTSALKFFNTHQLKCNLQRHPDCNNLKQWKGGTVKIDPLALVQAIERYLMVRGYGRIRDADSMVSDDDNSEDDIDDTLAAVVISQGPPKHKLQFLIGDVVLPFNMTVYQAVRQFGCSGVDHSEAEADSEPPLGHDAVWVQTHTIYYRPVPEEDAATSPKLGSSSQGNSRKGKGKSTKISSKRKEDSLWLEGTVPLQHCPLAPYLSPTLPPSVTITDASLDGLCLLRLLHALNRHWGILFPHLKSMSLLSPQDFINNKIAAKASRQLQDPLVIMTGNLPSWLQQIASVCPFLFPFETRQLLLYATSFDRDRALQRLLDSAPELSGSDSQERVTPRLERRKRTISRTDILKQAEQVIQDLASNKALLEVQYVNEVGTGLGPTLEFYALVSKELQRADLDLWNGSSNPTENGYVNSSHGLFPTPIPWNTKVSHLAKLKTKFKFLGKFMAKAIYDSRMLDLPFSLTFYRWLLGEEHTLTLADLAYVCPDVYRTLNKLQEVVRKKEAMEKDQTLRSHEKAQLIEALDLDSCPISELGLVFELPGYENIELRKGGSEIPVTIHNLDQYIKLVVHWFLYEGVFRQMEAFREGFESVFPPSQLRLFFPEELEAVFCGHAQTGGQWDVKILAECCRTDHGYTPDSRAIRFLFEVMAKYNSEEQRQFIQFVTGSPRLPVGGFKSLTPPLTIVRKTFDPSMKTDDFLPSVMTCVNYLKLPDYTTLEIMREKLRIAAQEGQHSFHLS